MLRLSQSTYYIESTCLMKVFVTWRSSYNFIIFFLTNVPTYVHYTKNSRCTGCLQADYFLTVSAETSCARNVLTKRTFCSKKNFSDQFICVFFFFHFCFFCGEKRQGFEKMKNIDESVVGTTNFCLKHIFFNLVSPFVVF